MDKTKNMADNTGTEYPGSPAEGEEKAPAEIGTESLFATGDLRQQAEPEIYICPLRIV
jgi:hypothetical protein